MKVQGSAKAKKTGPNQSVSAPQGHQLIMADLDQALFDEFSAILDKIALAVMEEKGAESKEDREVKHSEAPTKPKVSCGECRAPRAGTEPPAPRPRKAEPGEPQASDALPEAAVEEAAVEKAEESVELSDSGTETKEPSTEGVSEQAPVVELVEASLDQAVSKPVSEDGAPVVTEETELAVSTEGEQHAQPEFETELVELPHSESDQVEVADPQVEATDQQVEVTDQTPAEEDLDVVLELEPGSTEDPSIPVEQTLTSTEPESTDSEASKLEWFEGSESPVEIDQGGMQLPVPPTESEVAEGTTEVSVEPHTPNLGRSVEAHDKFAEQLIEHAGVDVKALEVAKPADGEFRAVAEVQGEFKAFGNAREVDPRDRMLAGLLLEVENLRPSKFGLELPARAVAASPVLTQLVNQELQSTVSQSLSPQNAPSIHGAGGATSAQTTETAARSSAPERLSRPVIVRTMERVEAALREAARSRDGKSLSLRLDPPSLGAMRVDVSIRDGVLHARLSAESNQVNQLLRERSGELQQMLRKLGLHVHQVTVSVGGESFDFEHREGGLKHRDRGSIRQRGEKFQDELNVKDAGRPSRGANAGTADHWVA